MEVALALGMEVIDIDEVQKRQADQQGRSARAQDDVESELRCRDPTAVLLGPCAPSLSTGLPRTSWHGEENAGGSRR